MTNIQEAELILSIMYGAARQVTRHLKGREQEVAQTKLIDTMIGAARVDRGEITKFPAIVATVRRHFRDAGTDAHDRKQILDKVHELNHEHEAEYDPETLLDR